MPSPALIDLLLLERGIAPQQVVEVMFNHVSRQILVRYLKPATVAASSERNIFQPSPEPAQILLPWPEN